MSVQDLEGYDEVMQKLMSFLSPEQRMAGLAPAQRMAGLTPEELLLALPDETLRGLSEEYIETLSPATRAAIRARRAK